MGVHRSRFSALKSPRARACGLALVVAACVGTVRAQEPSTADASASVRSAPDAPRVTGTASENPAGYARIEIDSGLVAHVPSEERSALEPYLAPLLLEARAQLSARYGPLGRDLVVTLYRSADEFARAGGATQPDSVQGLLLGEQVAILSPRGGALAWGRTLWHEVAHAFHQARSRGKVPRWFSEGLAEVDVGAARPSWVRHAGPSDTALPILELETLLEHRPPGDSAELARAYAHAFEVVAAIGDRRGAPGLQAMLAAWGRGQPTPRIVQGVLGMSVADLDAAVRTRVQERSRARRPEAVADGLRQAEAARRAGDRAAALRALEAASAIDAERPDVWNAILELARELRDEERTTRALERIAALDPYARDVLGYLLPRLARAGNWPALEQCARSLILIDPAHPGAHRALGRAYLEQGDASRALDELDRALALGIDPADPTRKLRARAAAQVGSAR